jgi:selenocysteine lyase/cysteine desulfurase
VAARIAARPDQVTFVPSAGRGVGIVLEAIDWRPGDNVVVGPSEFPSVLLAWQRLRPRGVEVRAVGREAVVAPDEIAAAVDARTRAIAVSHVGYLTGARHDLRRLRALADRAGARLVVDASHALGVVPVDGTLCDVVVACCYKWVLAVHGVGVFYANSGRWPELAAPWVGWHSTHREEDWRRRTDYRLRDDASRFEAGNPPFLPVYVLESALRVLDALDPRAVEAHVLGLGGTLRDGLVKLGLPVLTPEAPEERAGNIVFASGRCFDVERALRENGVLVWAGDGRIRLSVHAYNDEADVARALAVLEDLTARGAV